MELVPFQTRARTIDHLGRGQIADCPTAVSELWKNAYDAYAQHVALHIFDGEFPVAALVDDGHGMSKDEFVDRWLVVGTESKASSDLINEEDRNGLPPRERQGEKGIGRLSVAYLGPTALVLSKRKNQPFVAALVDWRLFENPHLNLVDVRVPVIEFSDRAEIGNILGSMFQSLAGNVNGEGLDEERTSRIREAWDRYTRNESARGSEITAMAILALANASQKVASNVTTRCLREWPAWSGAAEQGTALFVLNIHNELGVWVDPSAVKGDSEVEDNKENLRDTLAGFTDPYVDSPKSFSYRVVVHTGALSRVVISADRRFTLDDLMTLEHFVVGEVDELGVFRGRVRAFGVDFGEVSLPPARVPPTRSNSRVGPFAFCIGTFEQETDRTTHPPEIHRHLKDMADLYGGLGIYRDGLRVMPYGRPNADFFGIEERRSGHAGRSFWSYRRSFGRVGISRLENPNLKDKAGREGLIDNKAKRELRILVIDLLKQVANRYFNLESAPYHEYLPAIKAANRAAREAEERMKKRKTHVFRDAMRKQAEPLARALVEAERAQGDLKDIVDGGRPEELILFEDRLNQLRDYKAEFRLPPRPQKLGKLELSYREYRDRYTALCTATDTVASDWATAVERVKQKPPDEQARSVLGRHQAQLHLALKRWETKIVDRLDSEKNRTAQAIEEDRKRFYSDAAPLGIELEKGLTTLATVLRRMEDLGDALQVDFERRYGSYLRALEQLAEGIDLDAVVTWSGEQRDELQSQVEKLNSLAQLGITVEIVGHELDSIDADITRHTERLPTNVRRLSEFRDLVSAHSALVDRLRFLSPMKLSGSRAREEISGARIVNYVEEFFERRLETTGTKIVATEAFRSMLIREYPSRIFPVFINLVNNSLYWLSGEADKLIQFDLIDGSVIVADSGPGIDEDDLKMLFSLFFSRRVEGRGVGLYLCRANLSMGGHTINYVTDPALKLLKGANFIIRFQSLTHA
ncbi:ATP-binding protein [Singulisphaera rosea]